MVVEFSEKDSKTVSWFVYGSYIVIIIGLVITISYIFFSNTGWGAVWAIYYPTYSHLFLLLYIIPTFIIIRDLKNRKTKRSFIILGLCIFLVVTAMLPMIATPFCLYNIETQMNTTYGGNYTQLDTSQMLQQPFSLWASIHGIPIFEGEIEIQTDILFYNNSRDYFYFDWYKPKGTGPFPVVIAIHGGAWVTGNKGVRNIIPFSKYIASQGYSVFDIQYGVYRNDLNYSTTTNSPIVPAYNLSYFIQDQVANVGQFTHFIAANNDTYAADLNNVFILGRSAGGHIAGVVATGYNNSYFSGVFNETLQLKGAILYYPITDIKTQAHAYGAGITYADFRFNTLFNASLSQEELNTLYNYYSPYYLIQNSSVNIPPILVVHGTHDNLIPYWQQAFYFQQEALAQGRKCILVTLPFTGHAFDMLFHGYGGQVSTYYIERFIALEIT